MKIISIKKTRQPRKMLIAFFLALVFIFGNIFSNFYFVEAAFNKQINYQGKLTDASNIAVVDGTYNMEFKLYDALSGGITIWTETRTGAYKVQVTNGLFSVMLGEVNAFTTENFNQTLYLGVKIESDAEMTPRKKLGAVPAAVMAETVTGAAQTAITSLGNLTGLTVTGGSTLRSITVDNATVTNDRIAITAAALGANRFDGTITNADLTAARTYTLPDTTGTLITTGDSGTVTNTMLAGSIANAKLANSTISGIALGSNLATLTIGTGLSGTSYNGSGAVTIASTITQYTDALARSALSLTTTGTSGASTYNSATGAFNIPTYTLAGLGGQASSSSLTSLAALSWTSGTPFVKMTAAGTFALDTNTYLTGTKVDSFNTRTGAVTLTSADVTGALTFTPYNATNPSGYTSFAYSSVISGFVTGANSTVLNTDSLEVSIEKLQGQMNNKQASGSYEAPLTFTNGLTRTLNDIHLGGTLTEATTITQGSNAFTIANTGTANTTINLSSTGNFDVQDNGTSALYVKNDGNVGIGTTAPVGKLQVRNGLFVIDDVATGVFATSKFNSQGAAWSDDAILQSIVFNGAAAQRPEIAWLRGARTYPEFAIRQNTGADSGGTIYSGTGLVAPTATMTFNLGNVGIGTTAPGAKLEIDGTMAANGSSTAIAGILGGYTFNPTAGGVQVGNRFVVTNAPTTSANTAVGEMVRMVDSTSLSNLVRGLDISANAGSNTAGTNTGIRSSGATFGVQGITSALAGGQAAPAAIYGESTGTNQGDVLRLYSNTMTSATSFATFYQTVSAFTGTGLLMDFAVGGSGTFTGDFMNMKNNGASVFKVTSTGVTSLGLSGTASTNAVCSSLTNTTAPVAGTAYELRDCSGAPSADYAEMYPVESGTTYGDVVAMGSDIVETYDIGDNGEIDWTKVKGNISKLVKSKDAYQSSVIGIVSNNTNNFSSTGYNIKEGDNPMPIALNGRVPVKISESSSPIKVGDYITTSMEDGKAMRALKSGFVIGKALEDWTPESGKDGVMIFIEQGYYESDSAHEFVGEVKFGGLTFFNASVEFAKSVKFKDAVEFEVPPLFNNDTAGFAVIKAGAQKVDVTFDKAYIAQPVVSANIAMEDTDTTNMTDEEASAFFGEGVQSVVTNKTQNKFTIRINKVATKDIRFSWIALAVKNPKVFESVMPGLVITPPAITAPSLVQVPVTDLTASLIPPTDTVNNSGVTTPVVADTPATTEVPTVTQTTEATPVITTVVTAPVTTTDTPTTTVDASATPALN